MEPRPEIELFQSLNSEQKEAVEHWGSPLLISAGAGSGKTRVITAKIIYLIQKMNFSPSSVLAVTFTNKAANEMRERIARVLPEKTAQAIPIKTFHSWGALFLRRNAALLGLNPFFSVYDDDDSLKLLRILFPEIPAPEIKRFSRAVARAKNEALDPEETESLTRFHPDLRFPEIYGRYREKLGETGNVDFGDLLLLPLKAFHRHPHLRDLQREYIRAVLVDEYQDSNRIQFRLLRALVGEKTELCAVGDEDQSIYKFRGADIENILNFEKEFKGTRVIKLERNYRSTSGILAIASAVIRRNKDRLGKELWTDRREGKKPELHYFENQDEEALFWAKFIEKNPERETAVLYRTNAQSRAFETIFRRLNIPCRLVGNTAFYNREEVKDLLSYLVLSLNPKDEIAFRRVINKPGRGLGAASVKKILSFSREEGLSLLEGCRKAFLPKKQKAASQKFAGLFETELFSEENDGTLLSEILYRFYGKTGLKDYYEKKDGAEGTQRGENIQELCNGAGFYPPSREGLSEFLEMVQLTRTKDEEVSGSGPPVTLITVHNTKGLEFDRVILSGLEDSLFPGKGKEDPAELEEERRLFYVAVTRAKEELYFSYCRSRFIYGCYQDQYPSRFLNEIPETMLDRVEGGGYFPAPETGDETTVDSPYRPGKLVYHETYGPGIITRLRRREGHTVIRVRFENGHEAMFFPELTGGKLEVLGFPDA